ncbi:ankyrin repeat-containing domain protein [Aspergillus karnatakaensis]|uniref:ankyrin repeat domain-containing protein n=1 Tax=Aspergillus karnatakaensis TaxID=1810916 RepID=UPI003CCD4F50
MSVPQDSFETLPYDILILITLHIPVIDYYNAKLAGSAPLTSAIRSAYARLSKRQYLDCITKEDALENGYSACSRRPAMQILISRGRPCLVLDHIARYTQTGYAAHEQCEYNCERSYQITEKETAAFATALHWAAFYGQIEIMQLLLTRVNLRAGKDRQTALHYAARGNQVVAAELLLSHGAYVNAMDDRFRTPLAVALQRESHEIAELLKREGGYTEPLDILQKDEWARPIIECNPDMGIIMPLYRSHLYRSSGSKGLLRLLRYYGLKRNDATPDEIRDYQRVYVNDAIREDDLTFVRLMLDEGMDPNLRVARHGRTCLHLATMTDRVAIAKLLLDRGADPDLEDREKCRLSPFLFALFLRHGPLTELYLSHGWRIDRQDDQGRTPLSVLVGVLGRSTALLRYQLDFTSRVPLVQHLLSLGADVNRRNFFGETPLLVACRQLENSLDIVRVLVEGGADVNAADAKGHTPLLAAMERGYTRDHKEIVKFLTENGAESIREREESGH